MGLFGFSKKRNKFLSKAQKVEKSSNGLPKIEYFEPTWDDEGEQVEGSPLAAYRTYLKIPALRFMPWPAIERYNRWTKQWDNVPFINHDCEMAKKYPDDTAHGRPYHKVGRDQQCEGHPGICPNACR